jgi:hypothetical protein
MKLPTANLTFASLLLIIGCSDQSGPTAPTTELAVGGSSGCYTVKFLTMLTHVSGLVFTGPVTGDLQGTVDVVFNEFHPGTGATNLVAADATWHITGGIVPELIGETFVTRFTNRNVAQPGPVTKNIGSLDVISGVEKANVHYVGETSGFTGEPTLNFTGVICP